MYEVLTQILNIPSYEVVGVETNDEQITLDIQSTMEDAKCPRCGTYSSDLHENHPRIVRDLPISGKTCYLRFTRRRFLCPICQSPFSEPLSFVKEHRDYTNRYQVYFIRSERTILLLLCVLRNLHTIRLKASAKSYIPVTPS